jgi:hypothetical protein
VGEGGGEASRAGGNDGERAGADRKPGDAGRSGIADDPGIKPQYHHFVGSKASWDDLPEDGLERFVERNPSP